MGEENLEFGIKLSMRDPETKKVLEGLRGAQQGTERPPAVELADDIDRLALEVSRRNAIRGRENERRRSRQEEEVERWGRRAALGAASDVTQRFAAGTNLQDEIAKGKVLLGAAAAVFLQRLLDTIGQGLQASHLPGVTHVGRGLSGLSKGIGDMVPGLFGPQPDFADPAASGSQRTPADPWSTGNRVFPNQLSSFMQDPGPPNVDGLADAEVNRRPPTDNMLA